MLSESAFDYLFCLKFSFKFVTFSKSYVRKHNWLFFFLNTVNVYVTTDEVHNHRLQRFHKKVKRLIKVKLHKPAETTTSCDPQICRTVFLITWKPKQSGP